MLVSWFLLVHTCLTYDTMYVLTNYKYKITATATTASSKNEKNPL